MCEMSWKYNSRAKWREPFMSWWIFKCNDMRRKHTVVNGDWRHDFFFQKPYKTRQWGSTQHGKHGYQMEQLKPGHMVIAYQSDSNEFVGLARVVGLKKRGNHRDVYTGTFT